MKAYCAAAGIVREKASFKALRHSCATSMIERDVPIDYIAAHLGHGSIKNTMIYLHLRQSRKSEIAATKLRDWK